MFKRKFSDVFYQYSLSKWQIKLVFVLAGFGILVAVVWYTQSLLNELTIREQQTIKLYADIYRRTLEPNADMEEIGFLFNKITPTITFPMIITDKNDLPNKPFIVNTKNVFIDTTLNLVEQEKYLINLIREMGKEYPPLLVRESSGKILQKFYYTNSSLISRLKYFPMVEIIIISVFILIGYIAFSNIRRNEESKVWIGMSKEAAHQLGTPLSSLLAWLEIIRLNKANPDMVTETVNEMENDINRLNTIATRFSKIGSQPEKKVENLYVIIETVCQYFEKRLPHLGRKVKISRSLDRHIFAEINVDLFQWVIENLLKNAAEAIENKHGTVIIIMKDTDEKIISITVSDTGKGMSKKQRRQVFFPGYTTKKRGWGLGLSLCKRIIEEYHNGKIYVKDSLPGKGSTFAIELQKMEEV
ncbi:MAG: HAMP domain-containing sensor histidine kinase [bacterium]